MNKLCLITVLVCAVALVMGLAVHKMVVAQGADSECDLKKIEKAYWCEDCGKALEKDDIVEGYVCPTCDSQSYTAGKCSDCDEEREKAKWCIGCEGVFSEVKVDVCVKTGYVCEDCWITESFKPGKCCDEELKKVTVKARIIYRCPTCDHTQYEPGKCEEDEESRCYGKPLVKTCEKSGNFPHIKQ